MTFLLDTCAVSEYSEKSPNSRVIAFLESLDPAQTAVSAISLAEIYKGIELLPPSKRRLRLESWFRTDFQARYSGRIISFDERAAATWGVLVARLLRRGFTLGLADSLIAATALAHDLEIVTRNEDDFVHTGVRIVNPWK